MTIDNMQIDAQAFEKAEKGQNEFFVRVYQWKTPTITYGYNQKIDSLINLNEYAGWQILKRPTGGGIVFHHTGEISFTLILPKGRLKVTDAIEQTSKKIAAFLKAAGLDIKVEGVKRARQSDFCTAFVSRHEIILEGKKMVGIAQRFGRHAILQQGTIFGLYPEINPEKLKECLARQTCE